jgi:PKD repeat protein
MSYCWFDAGFTGSFGRCGTGSFGDTPVVRYSTTSGTHTITLTVSDPSGLSSSVTHTVTVP